MNDIRRIEPNGRRSRAVVANGLVFLAGQVADNGGDIEAQTREALSKVDAMLERAGTDKFHLISAQIWLRSLADLGAMNKIWDAWVVPGHEPTRCCGEVALADPKFLIEIVAVAALPREAGTGSV